MTATFPRMPNPMHQPMRPPMRPPALRLFSRWRLTIPLALMLHGAAQAETIARYGISMADIPLTTGQPDRGAVVAQLTPEQLDKMFEAVGELEAACARHAAIQLSASERDTLCGFHAKAQAAMRWRQRFNCPTQPAMTSGDHPRLRQSSADRHDAEPAPPAVAISAFAISSGRTDQRVI